MNFDPVPCLTYRAERVAQLVKFCKIGKKNKISISSGYTNLAKPRQTACKITSQVWRKVNGRCSFNGKTVLLFEAIRA